MAGRWGPQLPETISTASRFEILRLMLVLQPWLPPPAPTVTLDWLMQGLEAYFAQPPRDLITLNQVFSGRKTAALLNLEANLQQAGFMSAVQVECSRYLSRETPNWPRPCLPRWRRRSGPRKFNCSIMSFAPQKHNR